MRPLSKRFKREAVALATVIVFLCLYLPFMGAVWAIYLAVCGGYTALFFGLMWSDGKWSRYIKGASRSTGGLVQTHTVFLLVLILWMWLAQVARPFLPDWVVVEGGEHESWFLAFGALGLAAVWWAEQWWFTREPKLSL